MPCAFTTGLNRGSRRHRDRTALASDSKSRVWLALEIRGKTLFFPVPKACGFEPFRTTQFCGQFKRFLFFPTLFGFCQGAFCFR
jgi:hypothetical protein